LDKRAESSEGPDKNSYRKKTLKKGTGGGIAERGGEERRRAMKGLMSPREMMAL